MLGKLCGIDYLTFPLLLLAKLGWPTWGRDFKTQTVQLLGLQSEFVLSTQPVQKEGNASGEEQWQLLAGVDKQKRGCSHWGL